MAHMSYVSPAQNIQNNKINIKSPHTEIKYAQFCGLFANI